MDKTVVISLIKLLDDPDPEIFETVRRRLVSMGEDVIEELEKAWEICTSEVFQSRAEDIIQRIQYNITYRDLKIWAKSEERDLIDAAIIIAKYQYPDLDTVVLKEKISAIVNDIWLEINDKLTALEKIRVINHILFDIHKLTRISTKQLPSKVSFINYLINNQKGSPVLMGLFYAAIAQKLGMPVYGVDLPRSFILAYRDLYYSNIEGEEDTYQVLFYINPNNNGSVFSKREISHFIKEHKLADHPKNYSPASNIVVVMRLIDEMVYSFQEENNEYKAKDCQEMLNMLSHFPYTV